MLSELQKRILTGIFGVAVLVSLMIWGGWVGIFLITTILSLGMIFEFSRITFSLSDRQEKTYGLLIFAWLVDFCALALPNSDFEILIFSFLAFFTYFLLTARRHPQAETHFRELMSSLFGLVYLVFIPLFLIKLHAGMNGVKWTLLFFLIVWSADTGGYFAGRQFGKTKLYPEISPKKTVEGAIGGLVLALLVTIATKLTFFHDLSWIAVVFLPLIVGAVSQIGDLCESFLKRVFHTKDSGSILPGHGGFLDRFDGVVFSLPVMYAFSRLFS